MYYNESKLIEINWNDLKYIEMVWNILKWIEIEVNWNELMRNFTAPMNVSIYHVTVWFD